MQNREAEFPLLFYEQTKTTKNNINIKINVVFC